MDEYVADIALMISEKISTNISDIMNKLLRIFPEFGYYPTPRDYYIFYISKQMVQDKDFKCVIHKSLASCPVIIMGFHIIIYKFNRSYYIPSTKLYYLVLPHFIH